MMNLMLWFLLLSTNLVVGSHLRILDHQGEEGLHHAPPVTSLPAAVPDKLLYAVLVADRALVI